MELTKVAIADGDVLLCEGLKLILASERDLLVVGETTNGVEIAEIVARTKADVLLLDLMLPRRDAVSVLLDFKEKNILSKVLVLGRSTDRESILDTAKAGASGYILKRASATALIQAIRAVRRGEICVDRRLNCADMYLDFARHSWSHDGRKIRSKIVRGLTDRELEILALMAKGFTNEEIKNKLFIALQTVKVHIGHIFNKLNVKNRTQAALVFSQGEPDEFVKEMRRRPRRPDKVVSLPAPMGAVNPAPTERAIAEEA